MGKTVSSESQCPAGCEQASEDVIDNIVADLTGAPEVPGKPLVG